MKSMKVEYKGKCYRYNFSLMDIFSRFHWLAPLTRRKSSHVKKELQRIYKEHGQPGRLQSGNGGELKRQVKDNCKSREIKMINCRPYKAQGNVERSHRSLRQRYNMISYNRKKQALIGLRTYPTI